MNINDFGRNSFVRTIGLKERIQEAEKENQMREIKFRFWDTVEKKWMVDGRTETGIYDFAFKKNMNWRFLTKEQAEERIVVEQFTGLKDKNKKESYHHDLFVSPHRNGGNPIEIIWNNGGWWGKYIPQFGDEAMLFRLDYSEMIESEIIGSIHTHPELMEQGK